jgi:hypothetical protein
LAIGPARQIRLPVMIIDGNLSKDRMSALSKRDVGGGTWWWCSQRWPSVGRLTFGSLPKRDGMTPTAAATSADLSTNVVAKSGPQLLLSRYTHVVGTFMVRLLESWNQ